jgi:hypothetical protein
MPYDYKLRCLVDDEPITAHRSSKGDYYGWYTGEVITLHIENPDGTLDIRLDEKGSVSLKRHTKID